MAWTLDDAKDIATIAAATQQVIEAARNLLARHRKEAGGPELMRELHIEDDAHHIERDADVLRRRFGGEP